MFTGKKVLPFISSSLKGSLTIEAALGLSIFLLFSYSLIEPMRWMDRQRIVQAETDLLCEKLSIRSGDGILEPAEEIISEKLLEDRIIRKIGEKKDLKADLRIMRDDEDMIYAEVSYCEEIPFFFGGLREIPVRTVAGRRAFTGRSGGLSYDSFLTPEEEDVMVYVGKNCRRYHWYRDCHYLSNDYRTLSPEELSKARNSENNRYRPCETCGKKNPDCSVVYVTPGGDCYHTRVSCPAMTSYVRQVPLREVRELGVCSVCEKRKGEEP